jgi:hypothetical protein
MHMLVHTFATYPQSLPSRPLHLLLQQVPQPQHPKGPKRASTVSGAGDPLLHPRPRGLRRHKPDLHS